MTRISLPEAIAQLKQGQVVAVPTETVYGLAASLSQPEAIQKIFTLKGRPQSNPLIIHASSIQQIEPFTLTFPPNFTALASSFWPGPMTLVIPIIPQAISPIARAGLLTAGFRIPSHELTLKLLQEIGPLVMPSANVSGHPSSTRPEHVEEDFGLSFPVLEGGCCSKGIESTILYYYEDQWVILRLGALEPETFQDLLGYEPMVASIVTDRLLSPGNLFRHYAPRAKLILKGNIPSTVSCILGFEERIYPADKRVVYLGWLADPEGVAANLYQQLRHLDHLGIEAVWVDMDFPSNGLWRTIAERLQRASEKPS
jgi:L-threonylcarbamoyladenylate synthase